MQIAALLCLLFSVALALDGVIQLQVHQKSIHKDVFVKKQAARMAKWGKGARSLPKHHVKLLEAPFKNDYLTANISFGTPPQPFVVMLNSGSTRAWVLNSSYPQKSKDQHAYVIENSTTGTNAKGFFWNVDGTFNATGNYVSDVMRFGKAKVPGQYFGAVNAIIEDNDEFLFPVDGVLGLNHLIPDAYTDGEPVAPIDSLTFPLVKKTVSVFLDKQVAPSKGASVGLVTIGGYDKANCDMDSGSDTFYSVASKGKDNRYVTSVTGIEFNSYTTKSGSYNGYFDTALSTISVTATDLKAIYGILEPSYDWDTGLYTVDCDSISDISTFYINLGSLIAIDAENWVVDLDLDDNQCALALEITSNSLYPEEYVLGTPVFRSYCVFFDLEKDTVKFRDHLN